MVLNDATGFRVGENGFIKDGNSGRMGLYMRWRRRKNMFIYRMEKEEEWVLYRIKMEEECRRCENRIIWDGEEERIGLNVMEKVRE